MALEQQDSKFVEGFLTDLRNISNEARKKHSAVKEVCTTSMLPAFLPSCIRNCPFQASETAIIRLRNLSQNGNDVRQSKPTRPYVSFFTA